MYKPNTNFTQNVENMCKFTRKTTCKTAVKLRAKLKNFIHRVEISTFPPTFPVFPTIFPTINHTLLLPRLFHFFTDPTITTIKYLKERN